MLRHISVYVCTCERVFHAVCVTLQPLFINGRKWIAPEKEIAKLWQSLFVFWVFLVCCVRLALNLISFSFFGWYWPSKSFYFVVIRHVLLHLFMCVSFSDSWCYQSWFRPWWAQFCEKKNRKKIEFFFGLRNVDLCESYANSIYPRQKIPSFEIFCILECGQKKPCSNCFSIQGAQGAKIHLARLSTDLLSKHHDPNLNQKEKWWLWCVCVCDDVVKPCDCEHPWKHKTTKHETRHELLIFTLLSSCCISFFVASIVYEPSSN